MTRFEDGYYKNVLQSIVALQLQSPVESTPALWRVLPFLFCCRVG